MELFKEETGSAFCVYLTIYYGTLLPRRYIGSSRIEKIMKGYNGSIKSKKWSKIFSIEQRNNKHLFKTRVLSVHKTRIEATKQELFIQKKYDVVKNEKYINESFASPNGFFGRDVSGKNNPMYSKSHPNKNKKINSGNAGEKNPMYGLKGPDHPAYGYVRSDETNRKTSESLKGKSKTEQHKINIRKSRQTESYKRKIYRPIIVGGVYYESIKAALENSGKTHYFIHSRLKDKNNKEVYYSDGN
jgi:hypothetical protein